jgi:Predicted Zn-dependent hydrolases of the beta-lactamase fold
MLVAITWSGHSNFMLEEGGVKVLIDPYFVTKPGCALWVGGAGRSGSGLVTHDHHDHAGQAVEICRETGAMLGCIVGTGEKFSSAGRFRKSRL